MASFKICVVLAIAASMVNCQTYTESKGQEARQGFQSSNNVQAPSFSQSKQGDDNQNQQGVFSTVPSYPSFQNQQDNALKQRGSISPSIGQNPAVGDTKDGFQLPSFPGFGQGQEGGFPQFPGFGQDSNINNIFNQIQFPFGEGFNFGEAFQNFPFLGKPEVPATQNDYNFGQYQ